MNYGRVGDVDRLFEQQAVGWPFLAQGLKGLAESRTRSVRVRHYDLLVRHIPHRIKSTTAPVDAASVARRPCFLCAANLPAEEKGLALTSDFTAYCNPYPILANHMTVVHSDHRPQAIAGQVSAMAEIAEKLPGYFLIYNGPECGASAPDHLHFQACLRTVFPIERDTAGWNEGWFAGYSRRVFVLRDPSIRRIAERTERFVALLGEVTRRAPEPMLNIAMYFDGSRWTSFLFPRSKHRPRVYHTGELTVSPATIDFCGVFVVPKPEDFNRITGADIESIFEEVTLDAEAFAGLDARIKAEAL